MTRTRLAVVLGVVATVSVLATAALALATHVRDDEPAPPVLTDDVTGASIELTGGDWSVRGAADRISYGSAYVDGPAVLDEGYCRARPEGSFRAVAGFTDQDFEAWSRAVRGGEAAMSTGTSTEEVVLADGTRATYRWTALLGSGGPCAAAGIELAMVRAGDIRVVLVADSGEEGALSHDDVRRTLLTLRAS